MAKIRPGIGFGGLSGSAGSVTASGGASGHVLRVRPKAVRKDSAATGRARRAFSKASRGWGALSASVKAEWETWASGHRESDRLGAERALGGREAYQRLNGRLEIAGAALLTHPPSGYAESTVYEASLVASEALGLPYLIVPGFVGVLGGQAWVWVSVQSGGASRRWQDNLKLCVRQNLPGIPGIVNFTSEYTERWGTLLQGQKLWCLLRRLDTSTGLLSVPVLVSGTATA